MKKARYKDEVCRENSYSPKCKSIQGEKSASMKTSLATSPGRPYFV